MYRVGERRVENVVEIDRQQVEEALTTGLDKEDNDIGEVLPRCKRNEETNNTYDFDGVAGVVDVGPGIYHVRKKECLISAREVVASPVRKHVLVPLARQRFARESSTPL